MASRVAAVELQGLQHAENARRLYLHMQRAICQSLLGLASALEAKDPYTRGHSERVGAWGRRLAGALGLPPDQVDSIAQAGLLHDIGKIGVPEAVLRKRDALAPDEWTLVRNHPLIASQIVAPFEFLAGGVLAIRHHHERWDGTGYPDGLTGVAIPLGARILAVADVYDALMSDRPHRPALGRDTALAYLVTEAGRTLDGDVVAALLGLVHVDGPA
jgi:HD-GYP domain-containing protein (c-di-GMP phosphodiesterase class II)